MRSGDSSSSGSTVQADASSRQSPVDMRSARVSIGSRRMQGGSAASYASSVGHMVVRPGLDGTMRWP